MSPNKNTEVGIEDLLANEVCRKEKKASATKQVRPASSSESESDWTISINLFFYNHFNQLNLINKGATIDG